MVPNRLPPAGSTLPVVPLEENLSPIEFSKECLAELMDPDGWREVLETYASTVKMAVALTDRDGRMIGECHNPQPVWRMAHWANWEVENGCAFCLAPAAPCTAVADALRTGQVQMARDQAGLSHVAVPLTLGGRHLGALITGQVLTRYAEPLPLERVARNYGVSQQQLWRQAIQQVPITHAALRVYANLLKSLGDAYLGQRHAGILQRDLDATNRRYRLLIDGVKDYALFTVDRAGRVISWNSGAEHLFCYTAAEIVGQDAACLFIPEDVCGGAIKQSLHEADRVGWMETEGWRVRKDGTRFYATGVLAALGEGPSREYGGLIRDVTQLREWDEALRQAAKLESIGILAGGIAHDFNNLLAAITLSLDCAKADMPPDHPAYPMLEVAGQSSERAAELTTQLLAYAGKGKFVITRFDLSALILAMLPLIGASVPKTVQLQTLLAAKLPWIEGDASQIRQIVMNLIINGAESIGEAGGTVRISTGVTGEGEPGTPGTEVFMEVKDSGSGMSEETQARIFDPFFTTKFTGRGLGLAAVGGILRGHKGRMDVQSIPGEGSTFTVFFPSVPAGIVKVVEAPPLPVARGTGTVLFVDDEPSLRALAKLVLENSGYSVLLAENGREAVDVFRQNASRITVVLMDMTMPVMGGKEAFHLIREIRPEVPMIVLTGYSEQSMREELGADVIAGFIQKPYSTAKLAVAIQASLEAHALV